MSGIIMIDATTFIDVRTIDFLRIVDALRAGRHGARAVGRLLETVDDCGVNMICADELDATDFASFAAILEKLRRTLEGDDGLSRFLADLAATMAKDERLLADQETRRRE